MTVKDLKNRLALLDPDSVVVITDGIGWCNIDKIEVGGSEVRLFQETESLFSQS